jgi:NitT/TauT family transport system ATP-binding protein
MEAARPLVSLRRVAKTYANGTTALRDVSFDVASGEFVSLVGPSGCGKSTLLRLVAGLGDYSAGTVAVEGLAPARARAERGDMAFVFQEATLLPWRTVHANVALPLELKGEPTAARRVACREALEMVGLGDVATAYPRQLSGGMKMRVSLARALVAGPRVLLMDEPFGALDEMSRQRLNVELLRLCQIAGWTVLFVTHNVAEAVFLSSRILVMSSRPGRVVADFPVPLPHPREPQVRTTPEFNAVVSAVTGALQEA